MVQNYTPVMWDDKAFAFVPYEAFSDLPHYPKEKCEQICKELNGGLHHRQEEGYADSSKRRLVYGKSGNYRHEFQCPVTDER